MSSASNRRRRRSRRTSRDGQPPLRVVALDTMPRRCIVTVVLDVHGLGTEEAAQQYWAVRALSPLAVDVDDGELVAHFVRHAQSVEVAAWTLVDEIRALPQTRLSQVEAGRAGRVSADLVLTSGELSEPAWRHRAA